MSRFIPRGTYRVPAPIVVPPGESVTLPATTVRTVHDARGHELGYVVEDGIGTQRTGSAS